jgi:hypothetical protein
MRVNNLGFTVPPITTFKQYDDYMCEGAGGPGFSRTEYALLQEYWDIMVAKWSPKYVGELYYPHADPLIDDDPWGDALPEAIRLAHRLVPCKLGLWEIYYKRPHTNPPYDPYNDARNSEYYQEEDDLRDWVQACCRYNALVIAAWEGV